MSFLNSGEDDEEICKSIAKVIYQKRQSTFEAAIFSACNDIRKLASNSLIATEQTSFSLFKQIEKLIKINIANEREYFLTYLISSLGLQHKLPKDLLKLTTSEAFIQYENKDAKLKNYLRSIALHPDQCRQLTQSTLLSHFFFEASIVKDVIHDAKEIVEDYKKNFINELQAAKTTLFATLLEQFKDISRTQTQLTDYTIKNENELLLEASNKKIEELTNEIQLLEMENKVLKQDRNTYSQSDVDDERLKLIDSLKCCRLELADAKSENTKLVTDVISKTERLRDYYSIRSELDDLKAENINLKSENNSIMMQIESYKKEINEHQKQNSLLQRKIKRYEDIAAQNTTIMDKMESKLVEKIDQSKDLKKKVRQLENEIKQKNEDYNNLNSQLKEMDTTSSESSATIKSFQSKIQKLKATLSGKESQLDSMKVELASAISSLSQKSQQIKQITLELDNKTRLLERTTNKLSEVEENLAKMTASEEKSYKTIADQKSALIESENEMHSIKQQLNSTTEQMKRLASSRAAALSEAKRLRELIGEKEKELLTVKEELQIAHQKASELDDENKTITESMRRLLSKNKSENGQKLATQKTELEKALIKEKLEKQSNEHKIQMLTTLLQQAKADLEKSHEELVNARSEILSLQTNISEINIRSASQLSDLQTELRKAQHDASSAKQQLEAREAAQQRASELLKQTTDQYERDLKATSEQAAEDRRAYAAQNAELQAANTKLAAAVDSAKAAQVSLLQQMRAAAETSDGDIRKLKSELEKTSDDLVKANREIESLRNEIEEATTTIHTASNILFGPTPKSPVSPHKNRGFLEGVRSFAQHYNDKTRTIKDYSKEIESLKSTLTNVEKDSTQKGNDLRKLLEQTNSELEKIKREKQNLYEELDSTKRTMKSQQMNYEEKIEETKLSIDKMKKSMEEKIRDQADEISILNQERERTEKEIDDARSARFRAQGDIDTVMSAVSQTIKIESIHSIPGIIADLYKFKLETSKIADSESTTEILSFFTRITDGSKKLAAFTNESDISKASFSALALLQSLCKASQTKFSEFRAKSIETFNDFKRLQDFIFGAASARAAVGSNVVSFTIEVLEKLLNELESPLDELHAAVIDIKKEGNQKGDWLQQATALLSKFVGAVTGQNSLVARLSFPLSNEVSNQIFRILKDFRDRAESSKEAISNIIERASGCGYSGNSLEDAVDTIVAAARPTAEIEELRKLMEKQAETFEKTKGRLTKQVEDVRAKAREQTDAAERRSAQLLRENERLASKLRAGEAERAEQQRVREELVRFRSTAECDVGLLRSSLTPKERESLNI